MRLQDISAQAGQLAQDSDCSRPTSRAEASQHSDRAVSGAAESSGRSAHSEELPPRPWQQREQPDAKTSSVSDGFLTAAEYRSHKSGQQARLTSKLSNAITMPRLHDLLNLDCFAQ